MEYCNLWHCKDSGTYGTNISTNICYFIVVTFDVKYLKIPHCILPKIIYVEEENLIKIFAEGNEIPNMMMGLRLQYINRKSPWFYILQDLKDIFFGLPH